MSAPKWESPEEADRRVERRAAEDWYWRNVGWPSMRDTILLVGGMAMLKWMGVW